MKTRQKLRIGILGAGHIGKLLTLKLSEAGHEVKVANAGSPDLIDRGALKNGARAVWSTEVVRDIDVLITSLPLKVVPEIAYLVANLSPEVVHIDTSNYYPGRDSQIPAIEAGQTESVWAQEKYGRPIVKAWNSLGSDSLAKKGLPAGSPNRIALSVYGDIAKDKKVAMSLIEETGFDAYDAGLLSESWRQQPGAPAYGTDLTLKELPEKLTAAERERLPKRRGLAVAIFAERAGDKTTNPNTEFGVNVSRAINF